MENKETQFTSTGAKLLEHPVEMDLVRHNIYRPITLQLSPTDKCNLKCGFCSVKDREPKELELETILKVLDDLKPRGLKAIELTGGGDPTMYPKINKLLKYLDMGHYDVGMITNGVALKKNIRNDYLDKLKWVRISLNSLDQVADIDIPDIKGTLGFSYVVARDYNPATLDKVLEYTNKHNPDYVRIVPDCLDEEFMLEFQHILGPELETWHPKWFAQSKSYDKPKDECLFGLLKPFLNSDGYFYHCSAQALIDRQFSEAHRMGHWDEVDKIWTNPEGMNPKYCGKCFFKEQANMINYIRGNRIELYNANPNKVDIPHKNFI